MQTSRRLFVKIASKSGKTALALSKSGQLLCTCLIAVFSPFLNRFALQSLFCSIAAILAAKHAFDQVRDMIEKIIMLECRFFHFFARVSILLQLIFAIQSLHWTREAPAEKCRLGLAAMKRKILRIFLVIIF